MLSTLLCQQEIKSHSRTLKWDHHQSQPKKTIVPKEHMEAGVAVSAIMQRMSLSLEVATEVTDVNGNWKNLFDSENFLQLENKDIETLCL